MAVTPYPWPTFGGLDLRSEADVSGCPDQVNVDLDKPTAVRTRRGSRLFATPPGAPLSIERMRPFYRTAGDQVLAHFVENAASKVTAFHSAGDVVATQTMASATSVCDMASSGTPSAERAYVCDSGGPMFRWDGAAFTSIAGSPRCKYLATTADSRLVAANITTLPSGSGASSASSSLVCVSEKGDPETWPANNYIYLSPGDGDDITAAVSWQNMWFVFKRFKFFVFLGTGTDSAGNPEFDYRTIDTRVSAQTPFSVVAAPEGVYFVSGDGVYLTTGSAPVKVSTPLDPFFTGDTNPYWTGATLNSDTWGGGVDSTDTWGDGTSADTWGDGGVADLRLAYTNGRLHCFFYDHTGMFVYDVTNGRYVYWNLPVNSYSVTGMQFGEAGPEIVLIGQGAQIVRMDRAATTDSGMGITAHWRSPYFSPPNVLDQETTIKESILHGTGTVGFSMARDWATTMPTSAGGAKKLVKLGTSPAVAQSRHRKSQRGRTMSFQLETPTASDDFSSNTIANYTADVGATTNVTITGGVMQAAANLTTTNDLILTTGTFTDFGDSVNTLKATLGTTRTNFIAGLIFKRISANNSLTVYLTDSGAASTLQIFKIVNGVGGNLGSVPLSRISASTSYWIRVRIEGNVITVEHFTADPASSVAATTGTVTLTGSDATTYGSGVTGKSGIIFVPQQAAASVDDFSVVGGAWKVEDVTMQVTGIRAAALETT